MRGDRDQGTAGRRRAEKGAAPIEVAVVDARNGEVGKVSLPAPFSARVNDWVLFEQVIAQRASKRRGPAATKTRAFVSGGGKKPWKQKGTGRARAGSTRSPIWRGGAVIFGPHPRSYAYRLPRQARRYALMSALAQKARDGQVRVIDGFGLDAPKTKAMRELLAALGIKGSVLIVIAERDQNVELSARNLPRVRVLPVIGLNVDDVLGHETLLVARPALDGIDARLGR
jgi:large subunit ribosomal protein L4